MSIYNEYRPAQVSDGLFLRLKDGDSVKVRIASPPAVYDQSFEDPDTGTAKITTKYAWIVWNRVEAKAQIFSGGASIFNQIADLVEDWGEPTDFDIIIKRTGERLDTRWSVIPVQKSNDLTEEEVDKTNLLDLLGATKGHWLSDFVNKTDDEPKTVSRSTVEEVLDL